MTLGELWRRMWFLLRFDRRTRDLEEEMRLHVELRAERLRNAGVPANEATGAARARFGNTGVLTEAARGIWGGETFDGLARELRFAARALRRAPSLTATAVITLGVGIGASACIFTVVNAVLLRPLPYASSDRVIVVQHALPGLKMSAVNRLTRGMLFTYQRLSNSLEGVGAYQVVSVNVGDERRGSGVERAHASRMTANTLSILGVAPTIGRGFSETEDGPDGPVVALISNGLWRRTFNADPNVLGREIPIDGAPVRVIGVMPEHFRFPESNTDVWLPLKANPRSQYSGGFDQQSIARLRPGVDLVSAQRELQGLLARVGELYPLMAPGLPTAAMHAQVKPQVRLVSLRESLVADVASVLWIATAAAGLVLLVACANVANLLLVRIDARHKEVAVRTALGASRVRLLGHFLSEVGLLTVVGAALGFAGAAAGIKFFVRLAPADVPRLAEIRTDLAVVLFTILVTVAVAACCAALVAMRHRHETLSASLKDGARSGTTSRQRQRLRSTLVATQVALAVLLLASSGVLARSFARVRAIRPGFDATNALTMWLAVPGATYRSNDEIVRYYETLIGRLSAVPGVVAVGAASKLPLDGDGLRMTPMWPETGPLAKANLPPLNIITTVTSGYFRALNIPIVTGQNFSRTTGSAAPLEAIVSASVAQTFWGDSTGATVVGQRLRLRPGSPLYTVVGVAANVRDTSLLTPPSPIVYVAMQSTAATGSDSPPLETMGVVVRTSDNPLASAAALREAARAIDPAIPTFKVAPLQDVVSHSIARLTFTLFTLGAGAVVTLTLCMIGLYGVISYVVSLRTREIGVRIALGAQPLNIERLVARQALWLTLAGLAAGLSLFAVCARFLQSLVFGVAATDAGTLTAVAVGLTVVSMIATWLPARRAASIDPVEALRRE